MVDKKVDSRHLRLVIAKKLFGFATNVRLVANYGYGIEEIVMTTENYYNHATAVQRGRELSEQLGVELIVEKA